MNSIVQIENLTVTGGYGGLFEIDKTTGENYDDNAMTLYCKDENDQSVQVRIDDSATVKNTDGGTIKSYTYFKNLSDKGVKFTFIGYKQRYESETSGKVTYQLMLYSDEDIQYIGLE